MHTLDLTKQLIAYSSVTPDDAGCQSLLAARLKTLGFHIEHLRFGDVDNLWARYGSEAPLLVFLGHTDVVPTGPLDRWTFPPFTPTEHEGFLYGRGSADMKGNLAAMIVACEAFLKSGKKINGSIAFLITSDEEGIAINGTVKVVEHLKSRGEDITWCVVGEPSSSERVGDTIKNGRRGSLSARITVHGKQGHIAFPHLADNPIHRVLPALHTLTQTVWDQGNTFFPPTSFQISNVHSGTGAVNVIPGEIVIDCNFRYSTEVTAEQLQSQVQKIFDTHKLNTHIEWNHSARPFLTSPGTLVDACKSAVQEITGHTPKLATDGGTSDGRFIAPLGAQVIELGVCNKTLHQIDEHVAIQDLETITKIYQRVMEKLLRP